MPNHLIDIQQLKAHVENKEILKGFNLKVNPGEIHAIMGPNGAGKSTLAKVLAGHPSYELTQGKILLSNEEIHELEPEERSLKGLFISFQYPLEVQGISNFEFLYATYLAHQKNVGLEPSKEEFAQKIEGLAEQLQMKNEFLTRGLNTGFSGGEKKRNEILQMFLLNPKLAILDETDSGLDVDALRIVSQGINRFSNQENGVILITHYQRLLELVEPDFVHIMVDGQIVKSGTKELALEVEKSGYEAYLTCSKEN
ncbi:MAG: Fe-S cluster assembly ATPase SufC [Chlamydiae bacterium]|jgi:Fe-S cluster assembly ATP-binding protein|nr:Fe-S cluster assembly ATPase SufC [Chlamydiota bacterium]